MSDDDVEMNKLSALQILDESVKSQMTLMLIFASERGLSEHPILRRLFDDMALAHEALISDIYKRSGEAYRRERSQ